MTTTIQVVARGVLSLLACGALLAGCAGAGASSGSGGASSAAQATPADKAPAAPAASTAQAPAASNAAAPAGGGGAGAGKKLNKYTGNAEAAQQGRSLFLQYGCSGCHGAGGGGGMAPPVNDDVWKFGSDDETLYKLIKGQIPEQTMPKVYANLPDDDVWKILAFVRSIYGGDPQKINW